LRTAGHHLGALQRAPSSRRCAALRCAALPHARTPRRRAAPALLTALMATPADAGDAGNGDEATSPREGEQAGMCMRSPKEMASLFRALLSRSDDVFGVFGPDGRVLYISPAVERLLGYKPEELIGARERAAQRARAHAHESASRVSCTGFCASHRARADARTWARTALRRAHPAADGVRAP
jgi:PAS domain-containing protein